MFHLATVQGERERERQREGVRSKEAASKERTADRAKGERKRMV